MDSKIPIVSDGFTLATMTHDSKAPGIQYEAVTMYGSRDVIVAGKSVANNL
jgi:hypothetical protein